MTARRQLALMVLVQVLALSVWFSVSAVLPALRVEWMLDRAGGIWLTATVQIGFVVGAACTALITVFAGSAAVAAPLRLLTGVAMAGVYPVGLKIVVSWYPRARGMALGVLIGALSVGSALPQLLTAVAVLPWRGVLLAASGLALLGAVLSAVLLRPGPAAQPAPPLDPRYVVRMFADRPQRLINFGYFGHMWELYALWAWLPAYVAASFARHAAGSGGPFTVGATSFAVIGVAGAAGCVLGGRLAEQAWQCARRAGCDVAQFRLRDRFGRCVRRAPRGVRRPAVGLGWRCGRGLGPVLRCAVRRCRSALRGHRAYCADRDRVPAHRRHHRGTARAGRCRRLAAGDPDPGRRTAARRHRDDPADPHDPCRARNIPGEAWPERQVSPDPPLIMVALPDRR